MNSNWSYSLETLNSGENHVTFVLCDLEIWLMALKKRAPLLCYFYASVGSHWSIQTVVTFWKRPIRVKFRDFLHHFVTFMWIQTGLTVLNAQNGAKFILTSVTLTFDHWPLRFVWTLLLSMVITHENVMVIQWQKHYEKGVTDRQTYERERHCEIILSDIMHFSHSVH